MGSHRSNSSRAALFISAAAVSAFALAAHADTGVRYTIRLERGAKPRAAVRLDLSGIPADRKSITLEMPQSFAFARLPAPLMDGELRATLKDKPLSVAHDSPFEWTVSTDGAEAIAVNYAVPLTHRALPEVRERDAYEYPYLADDHGMLMTATLVAHPRDLEFAAARVEFEVPEGWAIIAPWKRIDARSFEVDDRSSLSNDLIAVGAWKTHEIEAGRYRCTIAIAPGQTALENAVVEPIRRIVEHELALFGRAPEGQYLFLFGRPDMRGMAGSPKTRSMTLSVAPEIAAFAGKHLAHLVAHEFHHTWGGAPTPTGDDLRFLGEGFTDYFAFLVSARLGLISWDDFASELAKKMKTCASSPLRGKISLTDAGGSVFFSDHDAYDLTYAAGTLVAAWLDRALRTHAKDASLDELMRRFRNDSKWRNLAVQPHVDDLVQAVEAYAGAEIAAELREIVTKPFEFDSATRLSRVGAPVSASNAPCKAEIRANFDGTRIRDLDPECLAARVGMRAGDELVEVNGVKITSAKDAMSAFAKPVDGRVKAVVRRSGVGGATTGAKSGRSESGDSAAGEIRIDEPVPSTRTFAVTPEIWKTHTP